MSQYYQKLHVINKEFTVWITYIGPKELFTNTNISSITDNKEFWKTVKPIFSDKICPKETINLVENDVILCDDQVVADTFNN